MVCNNLNLIREDLKSQLSKVQEDLTNTKAELRDEKRSRTLAENKLEEVERNLKLEGCDKVTQVVHLSEKVSLLQKMNSDLSDQLDAMTSRFTESEATRLCLSKVLENQRSENVLIKGEASRRIDRVRRTTV